MESPVIYEIDKVHTESIELRSYDAVYCLYGFICKPNIVLHNCKVVGRILDFSWITLRFAGLQPKYKSRSRCI